MSSFRLVNRFEPNAKDERSRFNAAFPLEAAKILNKYEHLISRRTKNVDSIGRTRTGAEIFALKEAEHLGKDIFVIEILFEVAGTDAT